MRERCIGFGDHCRGTVNHHDEQGVPGCCECFPLAFEDATVPADLRCRYCPKEGDE